MSGLALRNRVSLVVLLGVLWSPATVWAGNSEEVNAGLDVTLTGGAVVANVYTGASLWYNPAGLARYDGASPWCGSLTSQAPCWRPGSTNHRTNSVTPQPFLFRTSTSPF